MILNCGILTKKILGTCDFQVEIPFILADTSVSLTLQMAAGNAPRAISPFQMSITADGNTAQCLQYTIRKGFIENTGVRFVDATMQFPTGTISIGQQLVLTLSTAGGDFELAKLDVTGITGGNRSDTITAINDGEDWTALIGAIVTPENKTLTLFGDRAVMALNPFIVPGIILMIQDSPYQINSTTMHWSGALHRIEAFF